MNNTNRLPLPDDDMPPLPKLEEDGPQVCSTVQLYLAILDDLLPEQVQVLLEHVRTCPNCVTALRLMEGTTRVLANLPESVPSSRVDQAVTAAIAASSNRQLSANAPGGQSYTPDLTSQYPKREGKRSRDMVRESYPQNRGPLARTLSEGQITLVGGSSKSRGWKAIVPVALAAALILAFLATMHFLNSSTTSAFSLPANLSWNGYVLYQSETRIDAGGERYRVDSYDDLSSGQMHVETVMPGSLDVVALDDGYAILGLDMMHHVAQWGAKAWIVDETPFNLAELRSDLGTHRAVYLDKDMFRGQPVYRIRTRNGLVLLLDMNYRPVNVLRGAVGPGTGEPIYDALMLMPASHVSSSMWDMNIPPGFQMGTLPKAA